MRNFRQEQDILFRCSLALARIRDYRKKRIPSKLQSEVKFLLNTRTLRTLRMKLSPEFDMRKDPD